MHLFAGEKAGLLGLMVVQAGDEADAEILFVVAEEPLAAQRVLVGVAVVAVAVTVLLGEDVVLGEIAFLAADCQLHFTGVEAAVGEATVGVVTALAGGEVDVATDVVQPIARVVGAAHHFDVLDVQREDHVDETLVAAVDVAWHPIDEGLDPIDVALAVERAERDLARLRALPGFGELNPRHLSQQLPTVHYVLVLDLIATQHIDRCQHIFGAQGATNAGRSRMGNVHIAEDDGGIAGRLGEQVRGDHCREDGKGGRGESHGSSWCAGCRRGLSAGYRGTGLGLLFENTLYHNVIKSIRFSSVGNAWMF